MSGKIICRTVGACVGYQQTWPSSGRGVLPLVYERDKDNTVIVVFADYQSADLKLLKKDKRIRILYEAPEARNTRENHEDSRNTLVVFEID